MAASVRRLTFAEFIASVSDALVKAKTGRITLCVQHGEEIAALIPIGDYRTHLRLVREEEDRIDNAAVINARRDSEQGTPLETLIAEIHAESTTEDD